MAVTMLTGLGTEDSALGGEVRSLGGSRQGWLGAPSNLGFSACCTLGLHLDTQCSLLQGHSQRALGLGGRREALGLLGHSPHLAPSLDKQTVAEVSCGQAGLLCCLHTGTSLLDSELQKGRQGSGLSWHRQAPKSNRLSTPPLCL